MTEYERIRLACLAALISVKREAPYDTGNLRKSIKIAYRRGEIRIYINVGDGDARVRSGKKTDGEAPYAKYTNEPWSRFKPPLQGKQNPNEGWFDRAAENAAAKIARMLGGELKRL